MRRYVLTGTPGAGKSSLLRVLQQRGFPVVAEAATDVIAAAQAAGVSEPWSQPPFIDAIVRMQRARQVNNGNSGGAPQFYDRSPVCTLALCRYLGTRSRRC